MTHGEKIRNARKRAGLTQKQLSIKYNIPLRSIEDWETNKHKCPDYVTNLLLRCMALDYPTDTKRILSEPKPTEPTYTFYDQFGKPLPQKLADLVRKEFLAGRVQAQDEYGENFYGELVPTTSKLGKLYQCTDIELDCEIPFGFLFRVIKEV